LAYDVENRTGGQKGEKEEVRRGGLSVAVVTSGL